MQTTLKKDLTFHGIGLHTGKPVNLHLRPAPAGHGIVFRRVDRDGGGVLIPAKWHHVEICPLNTRLRVGDTIVSTIEHLMAALSGCGVHNVLIDIDGPEVPIMDGSSAEFVRGILQAGLKRLAKPLQIIKILENVSVHHGDAWASLQPATSLQIDFEIDFADAAIGHQAKTLNMANGSFVHTLCDSRTFCRNADVEEMRARGLALGGTLENAVVVDGDKVLTPGGLRHADEAVRHKMLDALGDLYTAGAPILGRYTGHKAGHNLSNALLRALFDRPSAWRLVDCTPQIAARLPGQGLSAADLNAVA
ncbi:UDP-3-O-acyl-N-acetylglucosamine deacetylase [Loktanella sp. SALINAS62]|uniref:UDP-3-O-acyl-N-acetylglucosamine deacetylase n=1 Tax=Loktanella sp. SALINAS62 TaxID=2706124 RepID=UPI001B8CBCBB|nr:UDP-3-O-acyl-N-acetylglucosamine deacetylase [Loktanella sp. SALINAS62]MBS1303809.1 UDP-3-O-acyl-N-acetylglucosamine deacetylase [Loktanella sp. SALINAS62]